MAEPAKNRVRIDDPIFERAVALIDAGDVDDLREHLDAHPHVLSTRAEDDGAFAGEYFARPFLLWFTAENPIRRGTLPANIREVIRTIIEAMHRHEVPNAQEQMDYTLALVASGCVPRECGLQVAMIQTLVEHGADPNTLDAALSHGEMDAAHALIECGATVDLTAAACLGDHDKLNALFDDADELTRQRALALAAFNGQATSCRILLDRGVDPNAFNPEGAHPHCTPLHNAVNRGHVETVVTLVTRGADMHIQDRMFGGDAFGWAEHCGQDEVLKMLHTLERYMPGVNAIRMGDIAALAAWVDAQPDMVGMYLPGNGRTPLHYVTDYGEVPNRAGMATVLLNRGADPNAKYAGPEHDETPLHWAASCDCTETIDVLIDGGADIDATGGVVEGGTPLQDAATFKQRKAAARLIERGASLEALTEPARQWLVAEGLA